MSWWDSIEGDSMQACLSTAPLQASALRTGSPASAARRASSARHSPRPGLPAPSRARTLLQVGLREVTGLGLSLLLLYPPPLRGTRWK